MKNLPFQGRTLALVAVIVSLLALLLYVALRSGPLAPVAVTVAMVENRAIQPALFGIGTVEARYTYKIGPTFAGRVKHLEVHVGDEVKAGQLLGEMDPVDLDDRVRAQESAFKRTQATLHEATARQVYAKTQARRYEKLLAVHSTSEESVATKRQELQIANAALAAAREDVTRARFDLKGLVAQRNNLRLIAPCDGIVAARDADPGTTVVAGQAVLEIIDPSSLWINARFDQMSAAGLAAALPASIVLRSRSGQTLKGRVLRVEPMADAVTEETLAKIVFNKRPEPLPPVGELAEITVQLPPLAATPVISNAAIRDVDGQRGVWKVERGKPVFTPVVLGRHDLQGHVQVKQGLSAGDHIIVYSEKALNRGSNLHIVDRIPGVSQ